MSRLVGNLGIVIAVMALLAVVETLAPFRAGGRWRRGHLVANLGLTGATLALNLMLGVGGTFVSQALRARGLGFFTSVALSPIAWLLVAVVALDFSNYFAHWFMHRVPSLWRIHRVHHSDPLVDVTTSLRQHPLENLLRFAFTMTTSWLLGMPVAVVALYRLASATNALLEHANIKLWQPLDGLLSLAVVTPNMHKVHHSRAQRETDSNYGNLFSLFDRVFGTFTPTARASAVEYGLDGYDAVDAHRLPVLFRLPFAKEMS